MVYKVIVYVILHPISIGNNKNIIREKIDTYISSFSSHIFIYAARPFLLMEIISVASDWFKREEKKLREEKKYIKLYH